MYIYIYTYFIYNNYIFIIIILVKLGRSPSLRHVLQNSAPLFREITLFWSFSMFLTIDFNSGSRSNKRVPNVFILNIIATRFAHTLSIFKLNLQNTEEKLFTKFGKNIILQKEFFQNKFKTKDLIFELKPKIVYF